MAAATLVGVGLLGPRLARAAKLHVSATQPGARIVIDGRETGLLTPSTVSGLAVGTHEVTVLSGACLRGSVQVEVSEEKVAEVSVDLTETTGTLVVQPVPGDATVELDGGRYPAEPGVPVAVACGQHQVAVSADGYVSAVLSVDVAGGETTRLPVELKAVGRGTIIVTARPRRSHILLDGEEVGVGSVTEEQVPAGPHVVRAELDGFVPEDQAVSLDDGQVIDLTFDLQHAKRSGRRHRLVGAGLVALGVGAGAFAAEEFVEASRAYGTYRSQVQDAENGQRKPAAVNAYYTDEVAPHRDRMWVGVAASGLLLGSGVVLMF